MQKILANWSPVNDGTQLTGKLYVSTEYGRVLPTVSGEVVTSEVAEMSIMDDGTLVAKTVDGREYSLQGRNNAIFEKFEGRVILKTS